MKLKLAWLRERLLAPARQIRWKIIAPYVILTLVLAAGGTFLATRMVTGSLEERFENQLAEAARVTSDAVVRREREHLELVRGIAFTEGVAAAIRDQNESALARLIEPLAANSRTDLVEVLDLDGQRVFGLRLVDAETLEYQAFAGDGDRSAWSVVTGVLAEIVDSLGDKYAQIAATEEGFALYTAGPIFHEDELVGVALIGSRLDSFLPVAKAEALADITIYDFEGSPIATTFAATGEGGEADLTPAAAVSARLDTPGAIRETKTLFGREFDLLYGELVIRDEAVGIYSVGLPRSFILSAAGTARWQLGLLFAVATVAVLMTGWLLARSLTAPLLQLVRVAKAVTGGDLTARTNIRMKDEVGQLAESFDKMTERLQKQHLSTIRALTSAIDARDPNTAGHSARVGQLAVTIGKALGLPESQLQHLEIGGYLHDIGKIGVRDSVLLKTGSLTPEERELIENHPRIGLEILAPVELAPEVIAFVSGHHEKLDGTGYPHGWSGEELSIIERIATVADIYDALTTGRPYRGPMSVDEALEIMSREVAEAKLDAHVFATFQGLVSRWEWRRHTDPDLRGFRLTDQQLNNAA
ncbi:MAG: HD domain-containing protein [Chloroflexi bacterium]|nr:HD domain-containing protein [Chloroflexota bacterium]